MQEKHFLSVPEIARIIGASPERTYALVSQGKIPAVRFGRRVRIPRIAFERWLEELNDAALANVRSQG